MSRFLPIPRRDLGHDAAEVLRRIAPHAPRHIDPADVHALDIVGGIEIVAFGVLTILMLALPNVEGHIPAPGLDLVLDTLAMLVTCTASILAATRFLERREVHALFQSSALAILALANAVAVVVAIVNQSSPGDELVEIGNAQLYIFTLSRIYAAALLVAGAVWALAGRSAGHPARLFLAHLIVMGLIVAMIELTAASLPPLIEATVTGAGIDARGDASATLAGAFLQSSGAALTMVAAFLSRRLWIRGGSTGDAYIALGLVAASFAQLHEIFFPSIHPIQVSTADVLWFTFAFALVLSITAVEQATYRALRAANEQLVLLHEADMDRAAFEERARLSRELHDGLAQDLWLAKLKVARLLSLPGLGPEPLLLGAELESAVDAGLADARQAVMALRFTGEEDATLSDLIRRFVEDFSDRFGLRADFDAEPELPRLPSRVEAELLRITQESLSNVRRHADATVVRVTLESAGDKLVLAVRDNGRGFDLDAVKEGSFGLAAMRERAAIAGMELMIKSGPGEGTVVQLVVPLPVSKAGDSPPPTMGGR